MESQQPARFRGLVLFGLVMLAPAFGAPAPDARVVLNTDRYVVGSRWTLDILVDTPESLSVRVPVPSLPSAVVLSEGPYIRETSWEKTPGKLSRATKVSLGFRAQQPGIVEVGPFEVRAGQSVQTLAPVTLYLLAADEAKRRFPVDVTWVKPQGPFYVGQAIPLILQARNLDTLAQPPDLGLVAPPGSLLERAVGLGEIEINSVGEDRLMNLPWGSWIILPTRAGPLTLPTVRATVTGLARNVAPLTLDVQPLPADAGPSRAVGDFSYSIDAKAGTAAQKGQLVVTQEVRGRGNFPYLVLPQVTAAPLTLVSRQEGNQYRAGASGYEGSLVVTWRFASDKAQPVTLALPGFQVFQPSTGKVNTWDDRILTVNLAVPAATGESTTPKIQPLTWDQVVAVRPWALTRSWESLLLFLPGPAFLVLTFLFRGKKRGLLVLVLAGGLFLSAAEPPPAGFQEALRGGADAPDLWKALAAKHQDEPGIWYNKALACQEAGRTAEAVHAFRMAVWAGFQGDQPIKALGVLEEKELLPDQLPSWTGLPTNWMFVFLCSAVNLAFLFWGLQRISGSTVWLLPVSLAILATAGLGIFTIGATTSRLEADAVVGLSDTPIHKVPGTLAESWMTLKAGTVVRVQGATDRWVLVQTGYGLEGWVDTSGLMAVPGNP